MFHFVLFWYNQLNPQAQFKKNNGVLTSKECIFMQYLVFGSRIDFSEKVYVKSQILVHEYWTILEHLFFEKCSSIHQYWDGPVSGT